MSSTDASTTVEEGAVRGLTYHTTQHATPMARTTGTGPGDPVRQFLDRGLGRLRRATSLTICARAVSLPTAVASISSTPC
jgi:hypothetical protein